MKIEELDERTAQEFFALPQTYSLIEKYRSEMDSEIWSDMTKLAVYVQCREQGVEKEFAAMRACRRACGTKNMDRTFNEGARRRMDGMGKNGERLVKIAQRAGISTQGKFYVGGLGRYTDPNAWVSTADDVLTVAKERNLTVTGVINHQGHDVPPPKMTTKLAPDIMRRYLKAYYSREPALRERVRRNPKALRELKERITHTHARKVK